MSYSATTHPEFLATLEQWFQSTAEILILVRYSHSAGAKSFEFFSSFQSLSHRISELPPLTCITAFKSAQLPIRGMVDDSFASRCLKLIPEGSEYLLVETVQRTYGRQSWYCWSAGTTLAELREHLEESRGISVAVGHYPPWLVDGDEVISAVVPDKNGDTSGGVY